jgi:hypothetical protein
MAAHALGTIGWLLSMGEVGPQREQADGDARRDGAMVHGGGPQRRAGPD